MKRSRYLAALFCVVALAGLLRSCGLASQALTVDDRSVAVSASNYMETGHPGPTMWNHPPLRNLLVYGSLTWFGPGPVALKLFSVVFGTLTVLLVALTARRLFGSEAVALVAALLLALDGLHIDFSRQAVHEVYTAFFGLGGVWSVLRFRDSARWRWLGLASLLFGLGLASKWDALFPLAVMAAVLAASEWRAGGSARLPRLALILAMLGCIPAITYLAVQLPVLQRGFDMADWFAMQASMLGETATHQGYNSYALVELTNNPLWWFLRPVGYADFVLDRGAPVVFIGLTNPLVWMLVLPAVYVLLSRALRERNGDQGITVALFAATYLPFALASRPIWVHSGFPALSYGVMAVAALCMERFPKAARWVYLALVAALAVPLYLLATGKGFDYPMLRWIVDSYRPAADRGL